MSLVDDDNSMAMYEHCTSSALNYLAFLRIYIHTCTDKIRLVLRASLKVLGNYVQFR